MSSLSWPALVFWVVVVGLLPLSSLAPDPHPRFGEPAVSTKIKLSALSLGPGPFPSNPEHMEFTMHGTAQRVTGQIRLTGLVTSSKGAIWSRMTLPNPQSGIKIKDVEIFKPLSNQLSWQVDLRFAVGGSPNTDHFGDGFAFWAITERGKLGNALGGPDSWNGLAVFFDTFKNDNFRIKKHPYVYGKVSSGYDNVHYENVNDQDQAVPGCHVPFRNPDPNVLDTTVARITYFENRISLVMRPRGAVDWLQCFEIKDVILPPQIYLGVSAMTGQLVDLHDFIQITTYANIDVQPFSYAVKNDPMQMPDLWTSMRESGKAAREFSDWEKEDEFKDELDWRVSDKVKAHVADDYDDAYQPHAYEHDEGEEDPYANYNEDEYEDEGRQADPSKQTATMKDLEKAVLGSNIGRALNKQHWANAEKMERMHKQLLNEMQDVTDSLHMAAREIRAREHEISDRIIKLAHTLKVSVVNPFEQEAEQSGGDWFWWFLLLAIMCGAVMMSGYGKYKKYMKSHVL